MTILSVAEMGERRTSATEENGERKYTRIFLVITNDAREDSSTVKDAEGIPAMFDAYSIDAFTNDEDEPEAGVFDPKALVKDKVARETLDNPFRWEVDVNYSSRARRPSLGAEDPLQRPAVYKWSTETIRLPVEKTIDGNFPRNSAGDPFDPPIEQDAAQRVLTITRNEASFDPGDLDQYSFTTNATSFFDYDPGAARMEPINGDEHFEADASFWVVTYVIKFRDRPDIDPADQWSSRPLDRGLREIDDLGNSDPIEDKGGRQVSVPVPLDGDGAKLDPVDTSSMVYLNFVIYEPVDWTPLDLESDYPG